MRFIWYPINEEEHTHDKNFSYNIPIFLLSSAHQDNHRISVDVAIHSLAPTQI